jgi:hypothetical protein
MGHKPGAEVVSAGENADHLLTGSRALYGAAVVSKDSLRSL